MAVAQPVDMAKANEILARFRPIAPKPAVPAPGAPAPDRAAATSRVLCLQSRPCRARKRGRPGLMPVAPPQAAKRQRAVSYPPLRSAATEATAMATAATRARMSVVVPSCAGLSLGSLSPTSAIAGDLMGLSIMGSASSPSPVVAERSVPMERDLLRKLQEPKVIAPRPVRPVGSTIHVESITDTSAAAASKNVVEVEAEVESDALPAVISDSRNRVRLANDAYKKMVGQPECPWLDSMPGAATSRRINGEVTLDVADSAPLPESSGGFSCTATIEWACDGKRGSVSAPCDVSRLRREPGDLFVWRFRIGEASVSYRTG